jgi:hypothetical protein
MGLHSSVTLFPRDPAHRLVGFDLAALVDRVGERLVALGDGAEARVTAGRYSREGLRSVVDVVAAIDEARVAGRGKADLELRIVGDARDDFGKFLGASTIDVSLRAFVGPQLLAGARLCAGCGWVVGDAEEPCGCGTSERETGDAELSACWWLQLHGRGSDGIGERFVEERRRLAGSPFFESLEGSARTRLLEWHSWDVPSHAAGTPASSGSGRARARKR